MLLLSIKKNEKKNVHRVLYRIPKWTWIFFLFPNRSNIPLSIHFPQFKLLFWVGNLFHGLFWVTVFVLSFFLGDQFLFRVTMTTVTSFVRVLIRLTTFWWWLLRETLWKFQFWGSKLDFLTFSPCFLWSKGTFLWHIKIFSEGKQSL